MEPTKWNAFTDELVQLSSDPGIQVVQKRKAWAGEEGIQWDAILEKTASAKLEAVKNTAKKVLKSPEARGAAIGAVGGTAAGINTEVKKRQEENGSPDAQTKRKGRLKYIAGRAVAGAAGGAALGSIGKHIGHETIEGAKKSIKNTFKKTPKAATEKKPGVFQRIKNTFKKKEKTP